MKKLRITFITLAIVLGIGAAFASTEKKVYIDGKRVNTVPPCYYDYQFRYVNGNMVWIYGTEGVSWVCMWGADNICTYSYTYDEAWHDWFYIPCKTGHYHEIPITDGEQPKPADTIRLTDKQRAFVEAQIAEAKSSQ